MIEPELALLQMQVKGRAAHAAELHEPGLCHAPEALDAVDVGRAARELVAVDDAPGNASCNPCGRCRRKSESRQYGSSPPVRPCRE